MAWRYGLTRDRVVLKKLRRVRDDIGLSRLDVVIRLGDYQGDLFWPICERTLQRYEAGQGVPGDRVKCFRRVYGCKERDLR